MRKTLAIFGICAALLATPAQAQIDTSDVRSAIHNGKKIYDIAKGWTNKRPYAMEQFDYADSMYFDMQLHRSLRKKFKTVTVSFSGQKVSTKNLPNRLEPWLSKIESSGGHVRLCAADNNWGFLKSITDLIFSAVKTVSDFATYMPARNYNADIIVYSFDKDRIVKIEFLRRSKGQSARKNCKTYSVKD